MTNDNAAGGKALKEEYILFENAACIVINKLCGEDSEKPPREGLYPVHRLDRPVSGCQLFAKDSGSAAFLSEVFSREAAAGEAPPKKAASAGEEPPAAAASATAGIEKRYWAIVEKTGKAALSSGGWTELVHTIRFDPKRNKSYADKADGKGKTARLLYRLAAAGENYLFMEIKLLTGRHHQIRAQLAAEGFHIKGDLKYGAKRSEREGGIRLHARVLAFPNPLEKTQTLRVEAPPPRQDALWRAFAEAVEAE